MYLFQPLEPLSAGTIWFFNLFEQSLEYEGSTTEIDGMVLEEHLERFTGDLAVEEEVVMAGYEENGSSAGLEVL